MGSTLLETQKPVLCSGTLIKDVSTASIFVQVGGEKDLEGYWNAVNGVGVGLNDL